MSSTGLELCHLCVEGWEVKLESRVVGKHFLAFNMESIWGQDVFDFELH